jgi:hypothetical protein
MIRSGSLTLTRSTPHRYLCRSTVPGGTPHLGLTSNQVWGLTKTDEEWAEALEAALAATRREDLEHGTNAAYQVVSPDCLRCLPRCGTPSGSSYLGLRRLPKAVCPREELTRISDLRPTIGTYMPAHPAAPMAAMRVLSVIP